jgi:NAD(P)-dependent dehydrogenase (short-subunit alcohol dehydrogenase family)
MSAVLVTGAAKRLGRAIALDLANAGWDVAVHYNGSTKDAEATANDIRVLGRRVALLQADVSREDETRALIGRATKELGPVTALINSASLFENDDWQSASRESWDKHMEVNLRAPFVLAQEFAKALPADMHGAIVNIVDQRVLKPTPQFITYSLSKAGLYWLNTTLAQALAPRIRVNAVAPGPTLPSPRQDAQAFARQVHALPLDRGPTPQDVADAVLYLASAASVTGATIAVDGGQHLAWRTVDAAEVEE